MKVCLVVPPYGYSDIPVSRSKFYPPLGLLSIASYAKSKLNYIDFVIHDNNTSFSDDDIQNVQVLGISPSILTYPQALDLARRAKDYGTTVVLGGYYASALADRILASTDVIDYIVIGDGEIPFTELLKGVNPSLIPGFVYRNGNVVVQNSPIQPCLDEYPFIDHSLVSLEAKIASFRDAYSLHGFSVPNIIYSQKDCLWASKTGGCIFCGRIDRKYRVRSPHRVWEEILRLHDIYGTDYIWDVSGSFIGNGTWLRQFHAMRPATNHVCLEVYGRAPEVDEESVQIMKDVGVYKIFIGAESGDIQKLNLAGKGSTPAINLRAVQLCAKNGIKLDLGFVIGLPGETKRTLERTILHVKQLVIEADVDTISCSILLPVPGSRAFKMLMDNPSTATKYTTGDYWDIKGMQIDWLTFFTDISYDYAVQVVDEILSYAPIKSGLIRFRDCKSEIKNYVN